MRFVFQLFVLLSVLLMVFGCSESLQNETNASRQAAASSAGGVFVIVEGGGDFPAELAGRWRGPSGWEFVFDEAGRIVSSVISMARAEVIPGRETTFVTRDAGDGSGEGVARYVPGDWVVIYRPYDRRLYVRAHMTYIYQEMGPGFIEGQQDTIFEGPVSEDGRTWRPTWYLYSTMFAVTPELHDFSNTPSEANRGEVVFNKAVMVN